MRLSKISLFGIAISGVAVAGVIWWASRQEPPKFPSTLSEWGSLVAAIALYAVATLIRGERWYRLLCADGATPTRADAQCLNTVGYAANNILPARAGDAVRVVLMAPRAKTSKKTVIGTLLAERLLDIAVILAVFVVVGYGLLGEAGVAQGRWILLGAAILAVVSVAAVLVLRRHERLRAIAAPILASTLALRGRHGLLLLVMTLAIWAIEACVWMSAAAASGFSMSPIEGCYIVALASVFALIPSGPGYAGTQDTAAVTGMLALGSTRSQAVTYLILIRFVLAVPITIVGLVLLATRYGGLRMLRLGRD